MLKSYSGLFCCSTMVAFVVFVLGLLVSLFVASVNLGERFLMASLFAAIAFIAALILGARDSLRHKSTMKKVRRMLLNRSDISETDFLSHFSGIDLVLLRQLRKSIADSFAVPETKIAPSDNLWSDYGCKVLEPGFHMSVIYHIVNARGINPNPGQIITFHSNALISIENLARELQRILDNIAENKENGENRQ